VNKSIDSGKSCTVEVTFTPKATGKRMGNLLINTDAVTPVVNVKLSGVGQSQGGLRGKYARKIV
jgi:hypothetical protein